MERMIGLSSRASSVKSVSVAQYIISGLPLSVALQSSLRKHLLRYRGQLFV